MIIADKSRALRAILLGGLIAGTLDISSDHASDNQRPALWHRHLSIHELRGAAAFGHPFQDVVFAGLVGGRDADPHAGDRTTDCSGGAQVFKVKPNQWK